MTGFELKILDFIQLIKCSFLDGVMMSVSSLGNYGMIWIVMGVSFLFFKRTRKMGITVLISLLLSLLLCNIVLKNIFMRARPFINNDFVLDIAPPSDSSFPSGHSSSAFSAAVSVFKYNRKYGIFVLLLAGVTAFSRLYLYVHFPTDVIAGVILGIINANLSYKLVKKLKIR